MAREDSKRGVFVHSVGKAREQTGRIRPTTAWDRLRGPRNGRYALGLVGEWSSLKESNGRLCT
jgi:hypothetical protein